MIICCPNCKARFKLNDDKVGDEGVKLRCTKCRTLFRVVNRLEQRPSSANSSLCGGMAVKVLMAHESPAFCDAVTKILASEQFLVSTYNDGRQAYEAIRSGKPDVVLLDVALPSMYGFEICEEVRKDESLASVKIILIASIYDKTRYKRSPQSLYGADDYIEKHHIPDDLATKIYSLMSEQKTCDAAQNGQSDEAGDTTDSRQVDEQDAVEQEEARRDLQKVEVRETSTASDVAEDGLDEADLKARRLARIIVSDIALYNQSKVEEGVRNGTFYQLLADEIREGDRLFKERVPKELRDDESFIKDAYVELIEKIQGELNL